MVDMVGFEAYGFVRGEWRRIVRDHINGEWFWFLITEGGGAVVPDLVMPRDSKSLPIPEGALS